MKCERCNKANELCVCDQIQTLENRHHVLILQHPQEPDHILGSARIAQLSLKNSTLKVGLSWPNLKAALGRETIPSRWMVLYLGSGVKEPNSPGEPTQTRGRGLSPGIHFVTHKGAPAPRPETLEGIVVLDGTWTQAKAIWWRNPWLLKLKRGILVPTRKSLYQELRKEPRRECLSTIESIAETLTALGEPVEIGENLRRVFSALLDKQRKRIRGDRA